MEGAGGRLLPRQGAACAQHTARMAGAKRGGYALPLKAGLAFSSSILTWKMKWSFVVGCHFYAHIS